MRSVRAAAVIISLWASSAAYANSPGWTISESSGSVAIMKSGVSNASFSRVAIKGGKVAEGDVIATEKTGRAVIVRGEEYVIVAPGSRLRIVDTAEENTLTQFFQSVGNSIFKIKKKTTPHFGVQTPFLAAVVKGTTFSVTVTDSGAAVQVTEGRVQVSTLDGAASHLVVPGEIGLVSQAMPYRLTVQGAETTVIDSPNRSSAKPKSESSASQAGDADETEESSFEGSVTADVGEGAVELGSVTGGLVSGNSTLVSTVNSTAKLAMIETPTAQSVANVDATPPTQVVATVESPEGPAITPLPPVDVPPGLTDIPPAPVVEPTEVVSSLPPTPLIEPTEVVTALPPTPVVVGQDAPEAPSSKPVAVVSSMPSAAPPTPVDSVVGDESFVAAATASAPSSMPAVSTEPVNAAAPVVNVAAAPSNNAGQIGNNGNTFGWGLNNGANQNNPAGQASGEDAQANDPGAIRRSFGGRGGQFWQNGGGNGRGGNQ
jgi:FecR protein